MFYWDVNIPEVIFFNYQFSWKIEGGTSLGSPYLEVKIKIKINKTAWEFQLAKTPNSIKIKRYIPTYFLSNMIGQFTRNLIVASHMTYRLAYANYSTSIHFPNSNTASCLTFASNGPTSIHGARRRGAATPPCRSRRSRSRWLFSAASHWGPLSSESIWAFACLYYYSSVCSPSVLRERLWLIFEL